MAKDHLIAAIDIGNNKIRTLIGMVEEGQKIPTIIGAGVSPSLGLRKGAVIDIEETINNITAALEDAERMVGKTVSHAFIGISGTHLDSYDTRGAIAIPYEEILEQDVDRVLETAQAINIPANKQVLKVIPKYFAIDNQAGIKYPVGMSGKKLEVEATMVAGDSPAIRNLEKCIHEAGIDIDDLIPNVLATPEAVLSKRQKELGVVVIDIGAGGTNMAVFEEGSLLSTAVLPVGGESVTNDIAIGLRTSIDVAERVKIEYGSCNRTEVGEKEEIDLGAFSKLDNQKISKRHLIEIIEARYYEIFLMVKDELRKVGRDGMLPAGAILTGAAVKIPGIIDLARNTLNLPVQIGFPLETNGVIEKVDDPSYTTAIGLLVWGARFEGKTGHSFKSINLGKGLSKVRGWIKKLLP